MARYLVTGGAGFIGSHIVEACLRAGHEVFALDNLFFGRMENLAGFEDLPGRFEFMEGDILDEACLASAMEGCTGVFHEAALPSVPRSIEEPLASHRVNATGTLKVLLAAREVGAKVVYAGSSSAYGDTEELPKHEDMPVHPGSPYAADKLAGEQMTTVFAKVYGLETVVLRYFNVLGPRQRADSPYSGVIAKFCMNAMAGLSCRVDGDGKQSRDFTYVADVVRGNLLAMEADLASGSVLNLAGGSRYSLLDLLAGLEEILGTSIKVRHGAARTGDVRHSQASVKRIREQLGFVCQCSFQDGLRATVDWYRAIGSG